MVENLRRGNKSATHPHQPFSQRGDNKKYMTQEQFRTTKFGVNSKFMYKEKVYGIITVDFEEELIGLAKEHNDGEYDILWVRYENCEEATPSLNN